MGSPERRRSGGTRCPAAHPTARPHQSSASLYKCERGGEQACLGCGTLPYGHASKRWFQAQAEGGTLPAHGDAGRRCRPLPSLPCPSSNKLTVVDRRIVIIYSPTLVLQEGQLSGIEHGGGALLSQHAHGHRHRAQPVLSALQRKGLGVAAVGGAAGGPGGVGPEEQQQQGVCERGKTWCVELAVKRSKAGCWPAGRAVTATAAGTHLSLPNNSRTRPSRCSSRFAWTGAGSGTAAEGRGGAGSWVGRRAVSGAGAGGALVSRAFARLPDYRNSRYLLRR